MSGASNTTSWKKNRVILKEIMRKKAEVNETKPNKIEELKNPKAAF